MPDHKPFGSDTLEIPMTIDRPPGEAWRGPMMSRMRRPGALFRNGVATPAAGGSEPGAESRAAPDTPE